LVALACFGSPAVHVGGFNPILFLVSVMLIAFALVPFLAPHCHHRTITVWSSYNARANPWTTRWFAESQPNRILAITLL